MEYWCGSVTEYMVSLIGDKVFNTSWWDYSGEFLNLNGRISLIYSIIWGLLALYLIKFANPKIDKFIDFIKSKFNIKLLKTLVVICIIFLFIDFLLSTFALDAYLTRVIVENNLDVKNKEQVIEKYDYLYNKNETLSNIIYTLWGNEVMVKTYPNVTVRTTSGENLLAKYYFPDILPYFYKFERN